ncbi:two-pore potassium channel 4-like [Prunus avium]|uniref:Two-pore potassium channel 4-like n=1 Tax=Prunus avium TaxID=42229 RepID=A0A6P5T5P0_PRUAV|nr:two-pore potassium channel 4-like [Prunus avium]
MAGNMQHQLPLQPIPYPLIFVPIVQFGLYFIFAITGFSFFHHFSSNKNSPPKLVRNSIVDGTYMAVVTFATVGYGDFVAHAIWEKWFAIAVIGIGCLYVEPCVNLCMIRLSDRLITHLYNRIFANAGNVEGNVIKIEFTCSILSIVLVVSVGVAGICIIEGHSFTDGLYFCVCSLALVGYGDLSFKTTGGKYFAIFWLPSSALIVRRAIDIIHHHFDSWRVHRLVPMVVTVVNWCHVVQTAGSLRQTDEGAATATRGLEEEGSATAAGPREVGEAAAAGPREEGEAAAAAQALAVQKGEQAGA